MDISSLGMAALLRKGLFPDGGCSLFNTELAKRNGRRTFLHAPTIRRDGAVPTLSADRQGCITCARRTKAARATSNAPQSLLPNLVNDYRVEVADANSGSIRASGFTMSSASLFSSSFASFSSSKVSWRSSADLSCPSNCAKVRTLP